MVWTVKISDKAKKQLSRLDKSAAKRIINFLQERIAPNEDPRSIGRALKGGEFGGYRRYQIGSYRVITKIKDNELCVLVVKVGHRKSIYK